MDFKEEYDKGFKAYRSKDYVNARKIFESLLIQDKNYFKALRMLINIDINQGKLREARENIENGMYYDNVNTLRLLSKIESTEYNYESFKDYIIKVLEKTEMAHKYNVSHFYNLVLFYILNGNFMEARKELRNIPENERKVLSDFYYITIDIIYGNYEKGLERLNKIDKEPLYKTYCVLYDRAISLLNFYLKRSKSEFEVLSFKGQKFRDHLYGSDSESIEMLLNNQMWYLREQEKFNDLKYRSDIDFKKLVEEIQYKITKMNPQYYNFMSNYSIILDDVVGYNGEVPIYGVSVSTPLGVNKISSISLADFSSEYDREHLSTDKNLRKRLLVK